MAQDSLQTEEVQEIDPTGFGSVKLKKYDDVMSSFVSIGVLGEDESYSMPSGVLAAMAKYLGGTLVRDMPPFLIPCIDGMAVVITIQQGHDYMGGAIFLSEEHLARLDRGILELWKRSKREQDVRAFFHGTAFNLVSPTTPLPESVESSWRCAFC